MASRRDQFRSYQFLVQRMVAALVMRETDPAQMPFRRLGGALFAGVMVAALMVAAVGIYGFIRPGGQNNWRKGSAIIIEKETGTRYVYREGRLHPVANFTSGRLLAGPAQAVRVSRNSLLDVPRGPRLGIADAPDGLPDRKHMFEGERPWTLCSRKDTDATGEEVPITVLYVGHEPRGGVRLGDEALLVEEPESGRLHLVWDNRRYPIEKPDTVLNGLGLSQEDRVQAGPAWLNSLPAGQPIRPQELSDTGKPAQAPGADGALVGQIYVNETLSGAKSFYLVHRDGLRAITEFQANIQRAAESTKKAYPGGAVTEKAVTSQADLPPASPPEGDDQPPATPPAMARGARQWSPVCAAFTDARSAPEVVLGAGAEPGEADVPTGSRTEVGTALADRIAVRPGWGALVESMPSEKAEVGTLYLVTDAGIRYPLVAPEVVALLGYSGLTPTRLPASLVARLPAGSPLDPAAAARPVEIG